METALFYLLRVSISAAVLYGCYKLILSKRTFHAINRVVVLSTIALTLILPLFTLQLPEINWPSEPEQNTVAEAAPEYMPAETNLIYANYAAAPVEAAPVEIPWQQILLIVYLAGVGLTVVRLLVSFTRMSLIIRKSDKKELSKNALLCITRKKVSPFSWLKYIVIGEKDLSDDSHDIIRHEQAHIDYKHSRDLLLFDLYTVLFWFNPFAWLLRRELQIVHEYQADEKVIALGVDLKNYQLLLIRKCVGEQKFALAHNFEYNNLQKRIRMTMTAKSSSRQKWLYSSIITAAFVAVGLLSWSRLQASGNNPADNPVVADSTKVVIDTAAVITGDGDYSQLKLLKGVVVDLDNVPVEAASLLAEKNGCLFTVRENGTVNLPTELGRKIHIRLYDGSHYKCEFVVTDSTKISRLKIVLQGHVGKNDWSGVKVFAQTEEEEKVTNRAIAEKTKGKPRLPWFQKSWGTDSIIAVVDGKVTPIEDCLRMQQNEVLYSSSGASADIVSRYDAKYKNKFVTVETKKGIRNARIYLNDTEISYEEMQKIYDNPLIPKSLWVIRDKQKLGVYGEKEKDCIVFLKTNDKRFKHTIKPVPANEQLSHGAKGFKDEKFKIGNIEAFAQGFTDQSTAVFIDGHLANKERFLRLKSSEILEMTLSDMFYYKELAKKLGLKQKSLINVKTKSGNAGVQGMSVSVSDKKKKYVEVVVSNEGIRQTGLTDQSTAIFIDGKLADKKAFDALQPEQIQNLGFGEIIYHKDLQQKYNLKQKTVLLIKLKPNHTQIVKNPTAIWSMMVTTRHASKKFDSSYLEENGFSEQKLPLIVLDGKEISLKEFYNMDRERPNGVTIVARGEKVIKYYGEKAKYGLLKLYSRKGIPVNDKTTAILIDGKLADKKAYDALDKSKIERITSTDISCCGKLDEKFNFKQKEIMQVTLKKESEN